MNLRDIVSEFCIDGQVLSISPAGNGHINDTYLVCTDCGNYILQRINTDVFTDPDALMQNVTAVTEFLDGPLKYIPTRSGEDHYIFCEKAADMDRIVTDLSGAYGRSADDTAAYWIGAADSVDLIEGCWRMMTCIGNSYSCESSDDPAVLHEIGRAYGSFISELAAFPAEILHETIAGFHDTRKRFNALLQAVELDAAGRKNSAQEEIRFALNMSGMWVFSVTWLLRASCL